MTIRSAPSLSDDAAANSSSFDSGVDWRRDAVVYQIYPRSFADSDGDGFGDLPGITAHLASVAEVGVDAVWLSPFYRSPQADGGYDVADYRDVDSLFGTLDDFDELLATAHGLGLKVIVDLVPNHSSDQHEWFIEALASPPGSPERDRYHFRDGSGPDGAEPPNNWPSVFGGSAWTRTIEPDGSPGQWYLHLFDSSQPDFNWENPAVREEFLSVLAFWLDRGVDGFRVDVANSLIKAPGYPDIHPDDTPGAMSAGPPAGTEAPPFVDEPLLTERAEPDSEGHQDPQGSPIWDRDEVHEVYRDWRNLVDTYQPPRILVAEAWVAPPARLARYVRPDEMHQAFNFDYLQTAWHAADLRAVITGSLAANDEVGAVTTWVLSNHDVVRHPSRFGLADTSRRPNGIGADDPQPDADLGIRRARAATALMLALPGSAYVWQGEELGLPEHTFLSDDQRQDPTYFRTNGKELGRDGCRVPLPWDSREAGLGFSPTGATWLPQPEAFIALARDRQVGDPESTLTLYQRLLKLRKELQLGRGQVTWIDDLGPDVVAFRNGGVTVVLNMGSDSVALPVGSVLVSSAPINADATLPGNAAVWLA